MQLLDGRGRNRIPLSLDNGDVRKYHQLEVISVCQTALAIIIPREKFLSLLLDLYVVKGEEQDYQDYVKS